MPPTFEIRDRVAFEPTTGCWLWLGKLHPAGYGKYRGKFAHRVSWEQSNGPIPEGLQIDHLCRTRCCVNPDHLEPVTQRENVLRGVGYAAQRAKATHCVNGHEFSPENTGRFRGGRVCRACKRERMALYGRRRKQP